MAVFYAALWLVFTLPLTVMHQRLWVQMAGKVRKPKLRGCIRPAALSRIAEVELKILNEHKRSNWKIE